MRELGLRALSGVVAAGLALGVAELIAAFLDADSAPPAALGNTVVDHTPVGLREWTINNFGTNDKLVLFLCMGLVAVLVAGFAGVVERSGRALGSALFVVFGAITAVIAVNRTSLSGVLPTIVGVGVGIYALRVLTRLIDNAVAAATIDTAPTESVPGAASDKTNAADTTTHGDGEAGSAPARSDPLRQVTDDPGATAENESTSAAAQSAERTAATTPERRQVLRALMVAGGIAVVAGVGGRLLGMQRRDVSGERAAVQLPQPKEPLTSIVPEAELRVPGITPYLTSNSDFYRIDTALTVPQVSMDDWSLRIHGMVDREIQLSWADLANRPAVERLVTLACVSNPVGGDLIGNARWLGYRLDELLAEAGPHPDADMVLSRSADGFTAGSPLSALTDGRDALLAIGMNGEPLPVAHGYPARLVVPGLYGYVSATKWVTELEITRFDRATAYWTRRGWSARGPIKTGTRIDTPGRRDRPSAGRIPIAGVAWAQHRGITGVEVQIDNGPWQPARLAADQSIDTWRQWVYDWDATAGKHTLRARATDSTGETQTEEFQDVIPDGATGYPSVTVQVG